MAACAWLNTVCLAQQHPSLARNTLQSCGPLSNRVLKCLKFGFTYTIPFGWVDRTQQIEDSSANAPNASGEAKDHTKVSAQGAPDWHLANRDERTGKAPVSETLLAVFERPPDAPGKTINSAVVIVAESQVSYPAVKSAADYFGPLSDIAEQHGLKAEGEPYAFPIGGKRLVREDFTGERGKTPLSQSSLVAIEHGEIVSFTFLAASKEEVEQLINRLTFSARRAQ
jgi:hypothetical protein